ncbi:hypothetical protein [Paenibacillus sp. Marseille-Q4541]|uniref:hypothetical protein n=1 Tax=Paenibacillus sp. Marseille-Q4541 TaxID=2831522 RepID=UPI001BABD443|nr:hypothetical protein [Paenibacillus sp. Marseille-Q4541]
MLPDYERKILRILYNYTSQRHRTPKINELEIKTGQTKERINEALLYLENENYIAWENKSNLEGIVILKGWEDESDIPRQFSSPNGSIDYWTEY